MFLVDVSSAACDDVVHMHAGTTPIRLATSKARSIVLPEDGPIGLKHVGVNDEIF